MGLCKLDIIVGAKRRGREGFDVKYQRPRKEGRERRKGGRREGLRL